MSISPWKYAHPLFLILLHGIISCQPYGSDGYHYLHRQEIIKVMRLHQTFMFLSENKRSAWLSASALFYLYFLLQVFFDITVGGHEVGRIVIGLFGEVAPLTVKNFVTLASGEVVFDVFWKYSFEFSFTGSLSIKLYYLQCNFAVYHSNLKKKSVQNNSNL